MELQHKRGVQANNPIDKTGFFYMDNNKIKYIRKYSKLFSNKKQIYSKERNIGSYHGSLQISGLKCLPDLGINLIPEEGQERLKISRTDKLPIKNDILTISILYHSNGSFRSITVDTINNIYMYMFSVEGKLCEEIFNDDTTYLL